MNSATRPRPGSPEHRDLFCSAFIDTHVAFDPEALPWPALDDVHLERMRSFPFWGHARSIEQNAGVMVSTFAETIDDPLIREAVALQGVEEHRHGRLLSHAIERYDIDAESTPIGPPSAAREDFLVFGFSECADSFIGFGAFAVARAKELFPQPLMTIFERVLFEEARHITFFVNWWRYEQARAGRDAFLERTFRELRYHAKAATTTAKTAQNSHAAPAIDARAAGEMLGGVTPAIFLAAALAENRRMLDKLDRRLIRPRLVPAVATALLMTIRLLPPRIAAGDFASPGRNPATIA